MSHEGWVLPLSVAFALVASGTAPAAIITVNNTGSASPITILDWDRGESDPGVSDSGGGGHDDESDDDRVYGAAGRWAPDGESTTYSFTGLAAGDYRIFATWLHDFARDDANGFVAANGFPVGTYDGVDTDTDFGGIDISQGFIAQKDTTVDPIGSPFEFVGVGTVQPAGDTLLVVVTSSGGHFRTDAIAIQVVPEPTSQALAAFGVLALMGLARRRRGLPRPPH